MKKLLPWIYILFGIVIWFFWYREFWKNTFTLPEQDFSRFNEVLWVLNNFYYDKEKINTGKMINNALKAYVDGLEDPYTVYLDAEDNSGFMEDLKGENDFEGIGAIISKKDYYVLVEEVIKDSPAAKAGILPLDRIIMIWTGSTKDISINDAVKKIRWPKGSILWVIIERINKDDSKELLEKQVIRDEITIPSVKSQILSDNIWYLEISIIWEETENLLKKELLNLQKNNIKGLIIDLRGNWWWFLPIAVEIASHFIPKNKLVVSSKYQELWEEKFYSQWYNWPRVPIVVLVDTLTASAGEIIALALQEQVNAKIIWTTTFWKGSIQTMTDFLNGDSLKYTIGERYSPSWKNINKIWITPDIEIEFDWEKYNINNIDNQLEKAKEYLQTS